MLCTLKPTIFAKSFSLFGSQGKPLEQFPGAIFFFSFFFFMVYRENHYSKRFLAHVSTFQKTVGKTFIILFIFLDFFDDSCRSRWAMPSFQATAFKDVRESFYFPCGYWSQGKGKSLFSWRFRKAVRKISSTTDGATTVNCCLTVTKTFPDGGIFGRWEMSILF